MTDVALTCQETPLAWPSSIDLKEIQTCSTCALHIFAPAPGSLQILTRRLHGGNGDGVNIDESPTIGADYRGQRYSLEEVVFHVPGLHIFPGQTEVYPAELHIHMRTFAAPKRGVTIVVPVSHKVKSIGSEYFAACNAKPDPTEKRPALTDVLHPGSKILTYQGPDLRGRTADLETPADHCTTEYERQFLLVLDAAEIRATDLERIPREGSLSTDVRDLPAPGVAPTITVPKDRILRSSVLADPGLPAVLSEHPPPVQSDKKELECKPLKVVDGRDVVDISGKPVDILKLLGIDVSGGPQNEPNADTALGVAKGVLMFVGTFLGLLFSDYFFGLIWGVFFDSSDGHLSNWEPLKMWIFLSISISAAGFSGGILGLLDSYFGLGLNLG